MSGWTQRCPCLSGWWQSLLRRPFPPDLFNVKFGTFCLVFAIALLYDLRKLHVFGGLSGHDNVKLEGVVVAVNSRKNYVLGAKFPMHLESVCSVAETCFGLMYWRQTHFKHHKEAWKLIVCCKLKNIVISVRLLDISVLQISHMQKG